MNKAFFSTVSTYSTAFYGKQYMTTFLVVIILIGENYEDRLL
jgi:hypothetical protein